MGTTAQKLQAIANSKAAIKAAIEAKGVSDVGNKLSDYATKIGQISGGGSSGDPRYEVSQQGVLSKKSFAVNYFNDVTSISSSGLRYAYYQSNVTSVSFPSLTSVGMWGLNYVFQGCSSLTSVDLSSLSSVGNSGLASAFQGCSSLTSVDLSSLTRVEKNGFDNAFNGCTSLTSVDLSSLTSVGRSGLGSAFQGCTSLTTVDLSSLSSVGDSGLNYAFKGCTHLELVDFSKATAVPTMSNINTFNDTNNTFKIVVPDALYDSWIVATNWSTYASHIVKASEYTPSV